MSKSPTGKDKGRATRFQDAQPFASKRLTPALIFHRYLSISFGPSIERLTSVSKDGTSLYLRRARTEESRVRIVVQNVPVINPNAVGNVAENKVDTGIREDV